MECSKIFRILFLTSGRALFASYFIFSSWQQYRDFGTDGGPTARYLMKRSDFFEPYDAVQIVGLGVSFTFFGSIYFVLGFRDSSDLFDLERFGIIVLFLRQVIAIPLLYDFYNYDADSAEYAQLSMYFMLNLALLGAILIMIGHRFEMPMKPKNVPKVQASNVQKKDVLILKMKETSNAKEQQEFKFSKGIDEVSEF